MRGISTIVEMARLICQQPLEVMATPGHGRSYGLSNRVLGRTLPGIVPCGLWKALSERSSLPSYGLLTDIGNDLLYDVPVNQIAEWIDTSLTRLSPQCEQIVITRLPVINLQRLGNARFICFRTILFPRCRKTLETIVDEAQQLNELVSQLAQRHHATLVEPQATWYGLDPIHIRIKNLSVAWSNVLENWNDGKKIENFFPSFRRWIYLRTLRPEKRNFFGVSNGQTQPSGQFADGSTISFY